MSNIFTILHLYKLNVCLSRSSSVSEKGTGTSQFQTDPENSRHTEECLPFQQAGEQTMTRGRTLRLQILFLRRVEIIHNCGLHKRIMPTFHFGKRAFQTAASTNQRPEMWTRTAVFATFRVKTEYCQKDFISKKENLLFSVLYVQLFKLYICSLICL